MSVSIVKVDIGDRQGTVTVKGDTQEEALGAEAKQVVLKTAANQGLPRPGLSGAAHAYPVDANGETSEDLVLGRGGVVAGYHADYPVTGGL